MFFGLKMFAEPVEPLGYSVSITFAFCKSLLIKANYALIYNNNNAKIINFIYLRIMYVVVHFFANSYFVKLAVFLCIFFSLTIQRLILLYELFLIYVATPLINYSTTLYIKCVCQK